MTATVTICPSDGRPEVEETRWFASVSNITCVRSVNDRGYRSYHDWFCTREEAEEWARGRAFELGWELVS